MVNADKLDLDKQKIVLKILKLINKAIDNTVYNTSRRMKTNLVNEVNVRGGVGVTGNLAKHSNWRVNRAHRHDQWSLIVDNIAAPYWEYLDAPYGPYPLKLDKGLLDRWVSLKFPNLSPSVQRKVTKDLAKDIRDKGHKTSKMANFMEAAMIKTIIQFFELFRVNLKKEVTSEKIYGK